MNVIVLVIGVTLMSIGGAIFLTANIGSDSLMVFNQGVSVVLGASIKDGITISNLVALVIILFINRKSLGIGSFAIIFLLGPGVQLVQATNILSTPNSFILQIIMVVCGVIIGGLGIALYMYADLGLSPFEGVIVTISNKYQWRFGIVKIVFDAIFFVSGMLLGGIFGWGSIITVFLYGPIIDIFSRLLQRSNIIKKQSV